MRASPESLSNTRLYLKSDKPTSTRSKTATVGCVCIPWILADALPVTAPTRQPVGIHTEKEPATSAAGSEGTRWGEGLGLLAEAIEDESLDLDVITEGLGDLLGEAVDGDGGVLDELLLAKDELLEVLLEATLGHALLDGLGLAGLGSLGLVDAHLVLDGGGGHVLAGGGDGSRGSDVHGDVVGEGLELVGGAGLGLGELADDDVGELATEVDVARHGAVLDGDALEAQDGAAALAQLAQLRQQSVDVKRLTEELIAHYRALMLAALPGGQALLSGVSPEEEAQYLEKGPQLGQREAIRAIRTLGTALEHMTRGSDQRIELELALFSLSEPPQQRQTVPVQAAPVARAAQPAAVQPFASAPAVQPFVSAPVQQAPVQQPVVEPAPLPEMPQPAAEPVQSAPEPTQEPASVQVPVQAEELPPLPEEPPVQGGEALPWEEPSAPARPVPPPREESSPALQTTAPAPKQEAAPAQPRPAAGSLALYPEWAQITQKLQEVDPMLYSYLRKSKAYFDGTRVLIDGGKTFRDFIRANKDSQRLIKKLILQVSGKAIPIGPYEPRTAGKAVSNAEQSLHALEKLGLDVSIEDTARKQK